MAKMRAGVVSAVVVAVVAGLVTVPAVAQGQEAGMSGVFEPFILAAIEFTGDVRLDEKRLTTILENIESLDQIETADEEDEDLADRMLREGRFDFDEFLKESAYVSWCAEHGFAPRDFLQGVMRLESLVMRDSIGAAAAEMKAQAPQQRKQLEEMRGTLGADAYGEALASFEASLAEFERVAAVAQRIPAPSAEEASLLAKYQSEIAAAMGDDEGDEDLEDPDDFDG